MPDPNASLDGLVQSAQQATAAGQAERAASLWQNILTKVPDHPQALLHLGQQALRRQDFNLALSLLERARAAAPRNPIIPLNLSFLFRATGNADAEMASLSQALSIDPYFYPALLSRGVLEETLGHLRIAAKTYRDVLKIAPPRDQMPPQLRASLAHAETVVREDAARLSKVLEDRLRETRGRFPGQNWERIERCKDIAAGTRKAYTAEPSMLLVPYLPAVQFYDNANFPWLQELEAATDDIRQEFLNVFTEDNQADFTPYINRPDDAPLNQWAELNRNPRWSVFFLWQSGRRVDKNCDRCPRTAELIERLPLCHIPNFAPNVVFSLLAPKTTIPPHSGDTNARLIGHLPLIVPEGCRFRVGNETRPWEVGKAWLFDDTLEHEARNDSDKLRVILMIDVWNPNLSVSERGAVADLLLGIHSYYYERT